MALGQIDNAEYGIHITCVIYTPDDELVHRGLMFKVMRRIYGTALMMGMKEQSDNWEMARTSELFMNGAFSDFEKRIKDLWRSPPIGSDAHFVISLPCFTPKPRQDRVRRDYIKSKGFSADNVPWRDLARYYTTGAPVNRRTFQRVTGIGNTSSGFDGDYRDEDLSLDPQALTSQFSHEELKEAEKSVEVLEKLTEGGPA